MARTIAVIRQSIIDAKNGINPMCVSGMDISYRVEVPNTLYSREY